MDEPEIPEIITPIFISEKPKVIPKPTLLFEDNISNKKIFKIPKSFYSEEKYYTIEVQDVDNKLVIIAKIKDDDIPYLENEFKNKFSLKDLQKINYFKMYDSIYDCLEDIFNGFLNEKMKTEEKNNILKITIPLPNKKYRSIPFELYKTIKTNIDKINELSTIIKNLKIKNENLEEKNEKLSQENKNLKETIYSVGNDSEISINIRKKGEITKYNLKITETLDDLFKKIKANEDNIRLLLNNSFIDISPGGNKKLAYYKIYNNALIDIIDDKLGGKYLIKTLSGKIITVDLEITDTINDIKSKIQDKEVIPIDKQRLIWKGVKLEGNKTICDYYIPKESIIYLVKNLNNNNHPI